MFCGYFARGAPMLKAAVSGGGPAVVNSRRRWCSSKVVKPAAVESSWQREQCFARLPEEYWFRKQEFAIMENVVTEEEAGVLLKDMERALKRRRYEKDHWDAVIVNFREMEHSRWSPESSAILANIRSAIQGTVPAPLEFLPKVHILDLHADGHIKPHVDSIKFSGGIVAGLSLLSDAVMRLRPVDPETDEPADESSIADFLLRQRSVYVMSGAARYSFTHEILETSDSVFDGEVVERDRRISVMFRDVLK